MEMYFMYGLRENRSNCIGLYYNKKNLERCEMCNAVNPNLTSFHSQEETSKLQEHLVMNEEEQKQIGKSLLLFILLLEVNVPV